MIRRREFIAGLGAAGWPIVARAQQAERVRRIGVLWAYPEDPLVHRFEAALRQGLAQFGWIEGHNLRIENRYGPVEQISDRAAELVRSAPDVIVVSSGPATRAVQQQTRLIPIVFVAVGDPVQNGIVKNVARPEGNATGFTNFFASFGGKWVDLLMEVAPQTSRVATVWDPAFQLGAFSASVETTAKAMAIELVHISARTPAEVALAIQAFAAQPNGGVLVSPAAGLLAAPAYKLAVEHKLPSVGAFRDSVGAFRESADAGALVSYGSNVTDLFRDAATYVDRILRGAKVGDLPVQFPTKFELVVNLKTAKAIGLTVPPSMLTRADEVIE